MRSVLQSLIAPSQSDLDFRKNIAGSRSYFFNTRIISENLGNLPGRDISGLFGSFRNSKVFCAEVPVCRADGHFSKEAEEFQMGEKKADIAEQGVYAPV